MNHIFVLKSSIAAVFLLAAMAVGQAQTTPDYSKMGLLELSTRAGRGDMKALDALQKLAKIIANRPGLENNPKGTGANAPALQTLGKSNGLLPSAGNSVEQPGKANSSNMRGMAEIRKEIEDIEQKIYARIAKIRAGDASESGKKETVRLLKRAKELNAELEVLKAIRLVEQVRKQTAIVGEISKKLSKTYSPSSSSRSMKPKEVMALAEKGDARAQNELAFRYREGKRGFNKDLAVSFEWMLKAANNGDTQAQNFTASNYFDGKGVAKDNQKAAQWLQKSAENGNKFAQFELHQELDGHWGIGGWKIFKRDLEAAGYWLNRAVEQKFLVAIDHGKNYHSDN